MLRSKVIDYWFSLFFDRPLILLELAASAGFTSGAYPVTGIHCPASPQDPSTSLSPSAGGTSSTQLLCKCWGCGLKSLCWDSIHWVPSPVPTRLISPISKQDHPLAQPGLIKEPELAISEMIRAGMNIFWRDARDLSFGYQTVEMIDREKLEFSWESHTVKRKRLKPGASQRNSSLGKIPHSSRNSQSTFKRDWRRDERAWGQRSTPCPEIIIIYTPCLRLKPQPHADPQGGLGSPWSSLFIFPVGHIESYFSCPLHSHLSGGPKEDGGGAWLVIA